MTAPRTLSQVQVGYLQLNFGYLLKGFYNKVFVWE